ncbi:hypothetical protein BOO91_11530 [Vibrio navarrensis]|uniref:Uncharacterized protein n=1 Tax=Vibrio navarrensis TaxID=29495 RepID=A0AAJ4LTP1_9VIBR|nr:MULTISPECIES: hypothetical protein [Vibrio]KJR29528.1 hypothetical protein UF06_11255 [Vibrio sp. S234-5]MBE3661556.1 hypothetical protein [Vibrio navarrensis]MBE4604747.1 hypothetical protein [Vibrio navarrensis]QPL52734.1 hypothetical protein I3X05_12065 [Vibrio navarrensis]
MEKGIIPKVWISVTFVTILILLIINILLWSDFGTKDSVEEKYLKRSENFSSDLGKETFTVEKLNSQIAVKSLRQSVFNDGFDIKATDVQSSSDGENMEINKRISNLEKEIIELSN